MSIRDLLFSVVFFYSVRVSLNQVPLRNLLVLDIFIVIGEIDEYRKRQIIWANIQLISLSGTFCVIHRGFANGLIDIMTKEIKITDYT